jgi:hypothetical protein
MRYSENMHWSEISSNPDHPDVVLFRGKKVESTYKASMDSYEDVIQYTCAAKTVIDFGAANHSADTDSISESNTHVLVVENSSKVVGVDIVEFSQICPEHCSHFIGNFLNAQTFPFAKADVIFAGHVIEHLDSPSQLFQFAEKLLNDSGRLVIVTPNPLWFIGLFYRNIGKTISVNADHVAIFGASELIELGERNGFEIVEWAYSGRADMSHEFRPGGRVLSRLINILYRILRVTNQSFSHNQIVAIFVRKH